MLGVFKKNLKEECYKLIFFLNTSNVACITLVLLHVVFFTIVLLRVFLVTFVFMYVSLFTVKISKQTLVLCFKLARSN
jgi:hypothetical protein